MLRLTLFITSGAFFRHADTRFRPQAWNDPFSSTCSSTRIAPVKYASKSARGDLQTQSNSGNPKTQVFAKDLRGTSFFRTGRQKLQHRFVNSSFPNHESLFSRFEAICRLAKGLLRRLERRLRRLRHPALQTTVRRARHAALQTPACLSLSEMKNNCSRGLRSFLRGASGEDKQLVFSLVLSTSVCEAAHRNSSTFVMVGFFVAVVVTVVFFAVVVVVIAIEGC